jgi:formylglycine-generating enzyme
MRFTRSTVLLAAAISAFLSATALGDVFHMPAGQTSMQFVTVGDPGNDGELSGQPKTGFDEPRICGAVAYTYQMGKFEVTAGQYTQFLNAVAKTDTYGLYTELMADPSISYCNIQRFGVPGSYTYSVAADWANRPVNWVDWGDAARYANWLTNGQPTGPQCAATTEGGSYALEGATGYAFNNVKRESNARFVIPSEDEWYKAAYYDPSKYGEGPGYYAYPNHEDFAPANTYPFGVNYGGRFGNQSPVGSPYWRSEVGAFQYDWSYYGTFDQAGNVSEWTEQVFGNGRGVRGGAFSSGPGPMAANYRDGWNAWGESGSIGFRIALVPEPSTMAVFLCGGLALFLRRSKRAGGR